MRVLDRAGGSRRALLRAARRRPCRNDRSALRWLPRASLIKHAFEALCINEFQGLEFEPDERGGGMRTGACVCARAWLC